MSKSRPSEKGERRPPSISTDLEFWRDVPAALVHDASGSRGNMSPKIRAMVPGARMLGRAFTVKCPVGDYGAVSRALDEASPGDVLVIDTGGTDRTPGCGGTAAAYAAHRGLAGCVTNGAVRDLEEIISVGLPVYATGTAVRGATGRSQQGSTGIPVSVGGVIVAPGDLVIGDADGVVVVSADHEEATRLRLGALMGRSHEIRAQLEVASTYLNLVER